MRENDRYWLAGLFEGEGWFGVNKRRISGKLYLSPGVSIKGVDADVIYAVKIFIGSGSLRSYTLPSQKECYVWSSSGIKAVEFMQLIHPIMSTRRQGQINQALAAWELRSTGKHIIPLNNDLKELLSAL